MQSGGDLSGLQKSIEGLLDTLTETTVLLEEFRYANQTRLLDNLSSVVTHFDRIATASAAAVGVSVPKQLFDFIDDGRNPELFTKRLLAESVRETELCKGKVDALADYYEQLRSHVVAAFPDLESELRPQHEAAEPATKKTRTEADV